MMSSNCGQFCLSLFEYYTPKIVKINNKTVGILNRVVQLSIICYIIGYAIIYNKGYQEFSDIESSVTTKLKGVVYTNFSHDEFNDLIPDPEVYHRIWDTSDYVVPPSESDAFFVVTNIVITSNQTQGRCPEDPTVSGAICQSDGDCAPHTQLVTGNGVLTGKCVQSDVNATLNVCEIMAWCPVERDINPLKGKRALLSDSKSFTVLLKNFVEFPKFGIRRRNIPDFKDANYLKHCHYHPVDDPLCPIFVMNDIVPGNYDELALKGAAIAIVIKWDCNFDFDPKKCYPTYEFRRLDEHSLLAPGLNFRYSQYYSDKRRTLFKAYGLKFIITPQGRGGRFSIVPLLLNVGSGVGLLAVATVLCDVVVLYIVKKRDLYKAMKYQCVTDENGHNNLDSVRKVGNEDKTYSGAGSSKSTIT